MLAVVVTVVAPRSAPKRRTGRYHLHSQNRCPSVSSTPTGFFVCYRHDVCTHHHQNAAFPRYRSGVGMRRELARKRETGRVRPRLPTLRSTLCFGHRRALAPIAFGRTSVPSVLPDAKGARSFRCLQAIPRRLGNACKHLCPPRSGLLRSGRAGLSPPLNPLRGERYRLRLLLFCRLPHCCGETHFPHPYLLLRGV